MILKDFIINDNSFHNFIDFFTSAVDIEVLHVPEESYIEIAKLLTKDGGDIDTMIEMVNSFPRVMYFYILLKKQDFVRLVSKIFPIKEASNDDIVVYIHSEENDSLYYFELIREKRTRHVKSIEELEGELNDAVDKEEYEEAIVIRNKIDKMVKKKKPKKK